MPCILKNRIPTEWSPNLAHAIGLITSDGCLSKDIPRISFGSKDMEMMTNFKRALALKNKITKHARGGETEKRFFCLSFKSRSFYDYLLTIGLTPAKSKTIQSVAISDKFFGDFLRGLFDGDGTFYSFRDTRWPNSFVYKISFASASTQFIYWLKERLGQLYRVKGCFHKGAGVLNLEYTKGDSNKLFRAMYYKENILFLGRKYYKIKAALEYDAKLHPDKKAYAAVA